MKPKPFLKLKLPLRKNCRLQISQEIETGLITADCMHFISVFIGFSFTFLFYISDIFCIYNKLFDGYFSSTAILFSGYAVVTVQLFFSFKKKYFEIDCTKLKILIAIPRKDIFCIFSELHRIFVSNSLLIFISVWFLLIQ